MRTSTAAFCFALAGTACATSQSIDPSLTRGGVTGEGGGDSAPPEYGGADPGGGFPGSGGLTGSGGFTAAGGFPATGGLRGTGGTPPPPPGTGGTQPMGTGGALPGTGGVSPAGTGGSSPGGAAGSCSTGEKACNGACVNFGPSNGCAAASCTACSMTAPQNGVLSCNAQGQCDFSCLSGFTKVGSNCRSPNAGDGGAIMCAGQSCTNSCNGGQPPCCNTVLNKCGCMLLGLCV